MRRKGEKGELGVGNLEGKRGDPEETQKVLLLLVQVFF